jgi:Zn-dependent protease
MSSGQPLPYGYSWTHAPPQTGQVTTSGRELVHIGVAYAVLTFDLVLLFSGGGLLFGTNSSSALFVVSPTIVAVAAGGAFTGFVAHELAHKVVAQRRGYWAEFRWSLTGLAFSVATAIFGFLWALPGATVVSGMADRKAWGRTALAGPMLNLVFGAMFYVAAIAAWQAGYVVFEWLLLLAFLNSWFAAFNLIPFGVLDGAKVRLWSSGVWAGAMALAASLAVVSWLAVFYYASPFLHS